MQLSGGGGGRSHVCLLSAYGSQCQRSAEVIFFFFHLNSPFSKNIAVFIFSETKKGEEGDGCVLKLEGVGGTSCRGSGGASRGDAH